MHSLISQLHLSDMIVDRNTNMGIDNIFKTSIWILQELSVRNTVAIAHTTSYKPQITVYENI